MSTAKNKRIPLQQRQGWEAVVNGFFHALAGKLEAARECYEHANESAMTPEGRGIAIKLRRSVRRERIQS